MVASLFFDWFGPDRSGWAAFELADLVLVGVAVLAGLAATSWAPRFVRRERGLLYIGLAGLAIVAEAIVNHPPGAAGRPVEYGAWLALTAALLITGGGLLRTARISVVVTLRPAGVPAQAGEPPPPAVGEDGREFVEDDIFPEGRIERPVEEEDHHIEEEGSEEETETLSISRRGR